MRTKARRRPIPRTGPAKSAQERLPGAESTDELVRRLEKALGTMQLGVTITDVAGRIVYTNPADARMHGYAEAELLGRDVGVFTPAEHRTPLTIQQMQSIGSWRRESVNVRKDGTTFAVQLLSDVVKNSADEPIGIVTTCEDITERKRREEELRRSRDELDQRVMKRTTELTAVIERLKHEIAERERAEQQQRHLEQQLRQAQKLEAVGQLTGGIAHDFNNILSVVLANADLVTTALPDEFTELRDSLADIASAAQHGANVVSQLLGFSRQAELRLLPLDLREVMAEQSEMLRHLIPANIEIRTTLGTPAGIVRADAGSVQQMLMNLVTNARDAMPDGGTIHIELDESSVDEAYTESHPGVTPGRYACLSVSDTGAGMDAETQAKIFEPFFTTKPIGKGTGLGMAMLYGLIKQHQGFVHVYSEVGEGTCVKLYLPIVAETAEVQRAPSRRTAIGRGTETILVAEDEDALRRTAKRALEKFGYTVLSAANGAEALALFRRHRDRIDLVLSDLIMPKMGGRELYHAVQREKPGVGFLLASGYSAGDAEERVSLELGVPFLRKPWTLKELAAHVRHALDAD